MTPIQCPSCRTSFQMAPEALKGRATVHCPACASVVVVAAGRGAAASSDPDTNAFVEPLPAAEVPTAVGAARAMLSLPKDKRVSIAILSGERKGDVVVLDEPTVTIGRTGGGASIEVPDPDVSRSHAALDCHGGRIVIRDLASHNGTFVAEKRVQGCDVDDRAEFRLGGTRFMLLVTPVD